MRKIELHLTTEWADATENMPRDIRNAAIGHLASWASDSEKYQVCRIYGETNGDLTAYYYRELPTGGVEHTYTIGGILRPTESGGEYTFHS